MSWSRLVSLLCSVSFPKAERNPTGNSNQDVEKCVLQKWNYLSGACAVLRRQGKDGVSGRFSSRVMHLEERFYCIFFIKTNQISKLEMCSLQTMTVGHRQVKTVTGEHNFCRFSEKKIWQPSGWRWAIHSWCSNFEPSIWIWTQNFLHFCLLFPVNCNWNWKKS